MSAFTLKIDLENASMRTADDVAAALRKVSAHLEGLVIPRKMQEVDGRIKDDNGNTVGSWKLVLPAPEY